MKCLTETASGAAPNYLADGTSLVVKILRGPWNDDLFRVLEGFPELAHDDEVDACSGALEMLNPNMNSWGIYELYRQQAENLRVEREATSGRAEPTWAIGSMEWLAEQKKSS